MAAPAVAQAPLRVPPGEEEDEEGPGDLVLASEQQRILWDSIQQQDREQRQQRQVGSGGASAASGGSTQRRTTAPPGARTTAPPGAPMSLPFGLLHCKDARAVGAPPRPGEPDMLAVRMADLVTEGCEFALVMQFGTSMVELFKCCPALRRVRRLLVFVDAEYKPGMDEEVEALQAQGEALPPDMQVWAALVPETLPGRRDGCHHTKMALLQYAAGMRLILQTGTIVREERSPLGDAVCWQDFPALPPADLAARAARPQCAFGATLFDFVGHTLGGALPPREKGDVLRWLAGHDFSCARFALVASVPGKHTGADLRAYGHLSLRRQLAAEAFAAVFRGGPVLILSPSLNYMHSGVWSDLKLSLTAGACQDGRPLGCADGDSWLRILWRSVDAVRNSKVWGWRAGSTQLRKALESSSSRGGTATLGRHLCRDEGREACGREGPILHLKVHLRTDPACEQVAWALVGSHNLSMAAWGSMVEGSKLWIKSYELGALLLPRLEAAYRRSPQCGFTCTPAAGAAPPGPDPAMEGMEGVRFVPYAPGTADCSRVVQDQDGSRMLQLPLPLPFSLKGTPYKEGDADPPFGLKDDYGPLRDYFGRTYREAKADLVPVETMAAEIMHQVELELLGGGGGEGSGTAAGGSRQQAGAKRRREEQHGQQDERYEQQVALAVQRSSFEHFERQRRNGNSGGAGGGSAAQGTVGAPGEPSEAQQEAWALAQSAQAAAAQEEADVRRAMEDSLRTASASGAAVQWQLQQQGGAAVDTIDLTGSDEEVG